MNWTAYLHPAFAEELALLPADLRLSFFSQLMLQEQKGPLSQALVFYYPHEDTIKLSFHTRFHYLDLGEKYLACLDTKIMPEAFIYLSAGAKTNDKTHCATALARLEDVKTGRVEAIKSLDYFHDIADPAEYKKAAKINSDIAKLAINQYWLAEAFDDAKKETAAIFNLCSPQMDRLLMRFDFFLDVLQQKLRARGGATGLEITFKGAEPRLVRSLKEFEKYPLNKNY